MVGASAGGDDCEVRSRTPLFRGSRCASRRRHRAAENVSRGARQQFRRALLPVARGARAGHGTAGRHTAVRACRRRFRAYRPRARGLQGTGRRHSRRRRPCAQANAIRGTSAERRRHRHAARVERHRAPLGRAHARRRRVEVCERAPPAGLRRAIDLRRHAMGRLRTERRAVVGTRARRDIGLPAGSCGGRADWPARRRNRHSSFAATVRR